MVFPEWLTQPGLNHFLVVSAILFSLGLLAVISRRNIIMVLMGIEVILNSANINFVAFSRYGVLSLDGHLFALFVIIIAAAEAAIALAIALNIYNRFGSVDIDHISELKN